jgi:SAM-dependent methyltransferase
MPLTSRYRWGTNYTSLNEKTILVQGAGFGWDAIAWATLRPKSVLAVDLMNYEPWWRDASDFAARELGVRVDFYQATLDKLTRIADRSIDVCSSMAVFEHVKNLAAVMRETHRILRDNGYVFAAYGPLWYCAGGDHVGARGNSDSPYNHLLLEKPEYEDYIRTHRLPSDDEYFDEYFKQDLFSHLTTADYLDIFARSGFVIEGIVLELSLDALKYLRRHPDMIGRLLQRHPQCGRDDFFIKSNIVRLRKSHRAAECPT